MQRKKDLVSGETDTFGFDAEQQRLISDMLKAQVRAAVSKGIHATSVERLKVLSKTKVLATMPDSYSSLSAGIGIKNITDISLLSDAVKYQPSKVILIITPEDIDDIMRWRSWDRKMKTIYTTFAMRMDAKVSQAVPNPVSMIHRRK